MLHQFRTGARAFVTDSDTFFERKVSEANISLEVLLVLVNGLLGLVGALYVGLEILEASEAEEMNFVVTGMIIEPLVLVFVFWALYSVVVHFVSSQYRGRGAISRVVKGMAWAMLPMALGNLVKSVGLFFALQDRDVGDLMVDVGSGPGDRATAVFDAAMSDPVMIAAVILFAGTVLWSGYLMVSVVEHAKGLTREQARKVVAIPVLIHVVFVVLSIVQGSPNYATILSLA
jgi:hypothetical protein